MVHYILRYRNCFALLLLGFLGDYTLGYAAEDNSPGEGIPGNASDSALVILPRQPLQTMIKDISRAMHVKIMVDGAIPETVFASPVKSKIVNEALQQAVSGTNYNIYTDINGNIVIRPGNPEHINVIAKRNEAETQYNVDSSASSTRTGGAIRTLPQSSRIITGALMADQQIQTIADAMRNASGMTVNKSSLQGSNSYTVRGYTATGMTNGMVDPAGAMQPTANVERIEVLKGPAALLSGGNNLGGSVNIVTKKPTADPLLNIEATYGSYNDRKITVDGSHALNHEKTLSARVVGNFADQDRTWSKYKGRKEYSIAPSIRFKNRIVDISVGVENAKARQPQIAYAVMSSPTTAPEIITEGRAFGPNNQGITMWNTRWYYEATWNITHWLTFVSRSHLSNTTMLANMYGPASNVGGNNYLFLKTTDRQVSHQQATDDYFRAKFKTFNIKHTVSTGLNYSQYTVSDYSSDPGKDDSIVIAPLDGQAQLSNFFPADTFQYNLGTRQLGTYAQDLIEYGRFHIFGAFRYTSYRSWGNNTKPVTIRKITPTAGMVIDLTKQLSIYGSWVMGFSPNFAIGTNNKLLPSQTTTNYEAGFKGQFLNKRLDLTAAIYRLDQSNYSVIAPGYTNRYTVLPGMRTQGVDIDLSGSISSGWKISGSLTYASFKFLSSSLDRYIVPAQPKFKYSLYTKYVVQSGALKNFGAAVGLYGNGSSSLSSYYPKYTLGAQHEIDLNFFYNYKKLLFNFGINNIENRNIYNLSANYTYITLTGPRMFRGTISYSFF